ncbi:MAG: hypothetical protein WD075_03225 [Rhodospirillales bacterium]
MGSLDNTASSNAAASIKSNHADQNEGAAPAAATIKSNHAERIGAAFTDATSFTPAPADSGDDFFKSLDPARSPFLNPPSAQRTVEGTSQESSQATPTLPPPPPMPARSGSLEDFGGTGQPVTPTSPRLPGQQTVQPVNTADGGGNAPENAARLAQQNADQQKQAEARQRQQRAQDAEREKRARAEAASGARMARFQAERAQRAAAASPGHPGLVDRPPLSDEAVASNERQVRALGRFRGVGDLPRFTTDAARNYGDKGLYEVGDLIHRTIKADPEQGRELLNETAAGIRLIACAPPSPAWQCRMIRRKPLPDRISRIRTLL